ncbi:MAG TPA: RluA family pseudouridine synthase [Spirochaetota bacterium]|nr:RluA family pseudouridine synthase [Spirochaetota bacterium]HOL58027.1 RluA family pseudouridine synthase [Spirochaetota bacterium]HPP05529.1 RluA family pseudouridine synthase [Spirochaetota bacterium]
MIEILYEDDWIIAVNKKAGILTIPNNKDDKNTLTSQLNELLKKRGLSLKAHPCHRLDRETSGVIIFAKGKKNQQEFMSLFHSNSVKKRYIALVRDRLDKKSGTINFKIENKEAITKYNVIKEYDGYSLVDIELFTGRTNQIRIHFKMIGHPLLGESKFAFRKDFNIKFKRVALHSEEISFFHPFLRKEITITADIPPDMKKLIF